MRPRHLLLYCAEYNLRNELAWLYDIRLRRSNVRPVIHEAASLPDMQRLLDRHMDKYGVIVMFRSFDGSQLGEDARVQEHMDKEAEAFYGRFKIFDASHPRVEMMSEIRALFFWEYKRGPIGPSGEAVRA